MEMIYRQSLASYLFQHTNRLNKHVWAKYRLGENLHACFHLFLLLQWNFKPQIKDVK